VTNFATTQSGADNNQLANTSLAPGGLPYDESGNVLNDGTNQYLYDAEGRICAVSNSPLPTMTIMTGYIYDADGTRVAKGNITSWSCDPTVNGFQTSSDYILGPSDEQVTEMGMDANNNMAWQHTNVWAAGSLISTYDNDGLHFYLNDPLGTRRAQTDSTGALEQTCASLPYGDSLACTNSTQFPTEHHFTGKERDAESGNDYFGARYYASSMGRFMSPDWGAHEDPVPYAKLDDPQSLNLYSYVLNNPLRTTDPDGHAGCRDSFTSFMQCAGNLFGYGHAVTNADLNGALASDAQNALKTMSAAGLQIGGVPAAQALQGKSNKDIVDALAGAQSALTAGTMGSMALNFDTSQLQHEFSHAGDFGIKGNWNKQAGQDFQQALEDIVKNPSTKEYTITFRGEAGYKAYLDPQSGKAVIFKPNGDFHAAWSLSADQVRAVVVNGKL
jgi:RHS repeat-associated protein